MPNPNSSTPNKPPVKPAAPPVPSKAAAPTKPAVGPKTAPPSDDEFFEGPESQSSSPGVEDDENLVMDLTDVDENAKGQFDALPAGIYSVVLESGTYKTSQRSGNKMVEWVFVVVGGDHENRKIFFHTTFSENGLPSMKKIVLIAKPDFDFKVFKPKSTPKECEGAAMRLKLRVKKDRESGELRNDVREVLPPAEGDEAAAGNDDEFLDKT